DEFPLRELDLLRVKGKNQPVRVYELLGGSAAEVSAEKRAAIAAYEEGLRLYRGKEWQAAEAAFERALAADPEDGPSLTYIERCRYFSHNPVEENWDGVFEMKTK
ncbi:MAG TPA: adenylate/guanylate cyclase domain-containing protein, partial [bacterium]|nr:adenylate/guanylate cyclase domain-containing protein [bacterium]